MSFQINMFASLIQTYPTWSELYRYLISPEGGSLRIVERAGYAIIRYVKGKSDMSREDIRQFRSVVWNLRTHRPVCVAPVKAQKRGEEPPAETDVSYSEFLDGSMIHVFSDDSQQKGYRIASRTQLDAESSFYTKTTFAEMFEQAVKKDRVQFSLSSNEFVNCVLQHPENRIVVPVSKPHLWITHYGKVDSEGNVTIFTNPSLWPAHLQQHAPQQYSFAQVKMLKDTFEQKGYVIQDKNSSRRWRMLHDEYEAVRMLRGAESNSVERFVRLRREGKVKIYLSYYKEENQSFWEFEKTLRQHTQDLGEFYARIKKTKEIGMKDIPFTFREHVYALHGQYLASLPTPKSIDKASVISYVNSLDNEKLVKFINASMFLDDHV